MSASGDSPTFRTSPFAIAALVCGIVQFGFPPASIAAVVLGHSARRKIRQTGEGGYGIATVGLILGYFVIASTVLVLVIGLVPGPQSGLH